MKKMLLLLIAVLGYTMLQAGQINWGVTAYGASGDTFVSTSSYAYLLKLESNDSSGIVAYLNASKTDTFDYNTIVVSGATKVGYVAYTEAFDSFNGETTVSSSADYGYYAVLVYDPDTGLYGLSSVSEVTSSSFTAGTIEDLGYAQLTLTVTTSTEIMEIPEPTVLALLALGVAGLALRRKTIA